MAALQGLRFMVMALLLCFFSKTAVVADTGTATYYTPPYVPSSCYGYQDNGVMIAAASDAIWNNRGACGINYAVKCVGAIPYPCRSDQSVVVKIVDYCPPGCRGTIDLSQEAFASIADPDAGVINISFQKV